MKPLEDSEFVIVGTGLMGASLALALRGKVKKMRGVERDTKARKFAATFFDEVTAHLGPAIKTADMIVLATPVRVIVQILETLKTTARPGTLIIDLGSSKGQIVAKMNELPDHLLAVGGHPMAGKESSGPAEAEASLFWDRAFVLVETLRTTPEAMDFAMQMVNAVGARVLRLTATRHDKAVAAISHLPYALSASLVRTVMFDAHDDSTPWELAASGFRDTSRLAGSNTTMMGDTLLTNREAVLDSLDQFRKQIDQLEDALRNSDEARLYDILETARLSRSDWFERYVNR